MCDCQGMERLSWPDVASRLGRLRAGAVESVQGCVVDTVHFGAEGRVAHYLTTSSDGKDNELVRFGTH